MSRPRYGHYFFDQGLVRGGTFWCLFLAVEKKTLAHLLKIGYEALKVFVRETTFRKEPVHEIQLRNIPNLKI